MIRLINFNKKWSDPQHSIQAVAFSSLVLICSLLFVKLSQLSVFSLGSLNILFGCLCLADLVLPQKLQIFSISKIWLKCFLLEHYLYNIKRYSKRLELSTIPISDVIEVEVPTISTIKSTCFFTVFSDFASKIVTRFLFDFTKLDCGFNIIF